MISIELQSDDIIKMRFAYSPLIELTKSYRLLDRTDQYPRYHHWIQEAKKALRGIEFPYIDAVILREIYVADFVTPTPTSTNSTIEDELQRVLETPEDIVRQNIQIAIEYEGLTPERQAFLDNPRMALDCLVQELELYWKLALAPHWPRIKSILEGDVLYQARNYALNGSDTLFVNLNQKMKYAERKLYLEQKCTISCGYPEVYSEENMEHSYQVGMLSYQLRGDGIQLVPSVFDTGTVSWQLHPHWQPMIIYGARGVGLWQQSELENLDETLTMVMGESKARLLQTLINPLNTGELAHHLHLTAGAVSQHLTKLSDAGLVESQRSGNRVYYRLSPRGERLLDVFV